jgi:hypothetical protein
LRLTIRAIGHCGISNSIRTSYPRRDDELGKIRTVVPTVTVVELVFHTTLGSFVVSTRGRKVENESVVFGTVSDIRLVHVPANSEGLGSVELELPTFDGNRGNECREKG